MVRRATSAHSIWRYTARENETVSCRWRTRMRTDAETEGTVVFLISMAAAAAATGFGYFQSRHFVRTKLRFVDAVQTGKAPVIAGIGAMVVAAPVVALLPIVGAGTAILFGLGVGTGVAAGAREIRQRIGTGA